MYLNKNDIIKIKDFIEDKEVSDGFIELYKFEEGIVTDITYEIRGNLIGVKCEGERLRFYLAKAKDGRWYFNVKEQVNHELFNVGNLDNYKIEIEKANKFFLDNSKRVKLKEPDSGEFNIERSVNAKTGTHSVIIKNLAIDNTELVIEELKALKQKGVSTIDINIYSKK